MTISKFFEGVLESLPYKYTNYIYIFHIFTHILHSLSLLHTPTLPPPTHTQRKKERKNLLHAGTRRDEMRGEVQVENHVSTYLVMETRGGEVS